MPGPSATNVGSTAAESLSLAALLAGRERKLHEYFRESPSASVDPLALRETSAPVETVWSPPASATGAEFIVLIVVVSGTLATRPSWTASWTTYFPGTSGTNVDTTPVALVNAAALPAGFDTNAHANCNWFPSASDEPLPSNVTGLPTAAV